MSEYTETVSTSVIILACLYLLILLFSPKKVNATTPFKILMHCGVVTCIAMFVSNNNVTFGKLIYVIGICWGGLFLAKTARDAGRITLKWSNFWKYRPKNYQKTCFLIITMILLGLAINSIESDILNHNLIP